jgi:two-component system, OmpR family, response regulator
LSAIQSQSSSSVKPAATVFVVDDEPMLLELAAAVLQPAGFNVRTFRDPQAALAEFSAANQRPAVVVTDYAMGAMNGLDFIRECRQIHPRQKILLLSGTVNESIYADAPVKPDCFLAKPYQSHDLIALVQSLAVA